MKVFQKKWVKILLLLAFCGTLIASVYLDVVTLWSKEVHLLEQKKVPYEESVIFKDLAFGANSYEIKQLCKVEETRWSIQGKKIRVREFGFDGSVETPVYSSGAQTTWEEFLKSQGMEGIRLVESWDEDMEAAIISEWGGMRQKDEFACISSRDFVRLLDVCPYTRIYDKEGFTEQEENIVYEDYADYDDTYFEDYEEYEKYAYDEYAEGRLNGLLSESLDFDWNDWSSYWNDRASLRLYESGKNFLIYNEKDGTLIGNRMQETLLSKIEKMTSIYFPVENALEGENDIDWLVALTNGFTSSLEQQLRYEFYMDTDWMAAFHGILTAIEVYQEDGSTFLSYGEPEDGDICISLVAKEDVAYVFGSDSDIYKKGYSLYVFFDKNYFNTTEDKLYEFLYTEGMKHGDRTDRAVGTTIATVIFGILLLISVVPSLWKREEEKLRDRVLLELNILFTIIVIAGCCGAIYGTGWLLAYVLLPLFNTGGVLLGGAIVSELIVLLGLAAVYMLISTIVYRIRKHCFMKGWLAGRVISWLCSKIRYVTKHIGSKIKLVIRHMDILKRRILWLVTIGVSSAIIMLIVCICAGVYYGFVGVFGFLCYIGFMIGFSYLFLKDAVDNKRLLDGCNRMKDGMFEEKIATANLYFDKLALAEAINTMGEGLEKAVSTSMRDERMKTELITNVSHDIKTPLTSIINYVDLLKRENTTPEQQQEYLKVLDAKSQRLKQLIEDLIEVSKTSTGNIELQLANLDFKELLNQALGEFQEKFAERNLELIVTCAEHRIQIWADGRRCYRILENLFSNVFKYAMPNTRVYVDLQQEMGQMVFIIKNISEAPLNVPVEELMERFVRGDVSRSTGGSGLGLSIVQNLVSLQQGKMDIKLDGDLFKVEIRFPILP